MYRLAKDGYKDMAVLALDPEYDIANDFRLNFLKNQHGVEVDYVYRFFAPAIIHKLFAWLLLQNPISIWKRFIKHITFRYVFGFEWALSMFTERKVSLVIFDWQEPKRYVTRSLFDAAKKLNIQRIGLPHGISLYTNDMWTVSTFTKKKLPDFGNKWKNFEKIVVQFDHYKQTVARAGVPEEKLHVLGSTRFCSEWEGIYWVLVPRSKDYSGNGNPGKLKVVYMDHSPEYRINVDVVLESIEKLSRLEFIDLVVKPSTASPDAVASRKLYELSQVDYKTSSVELIRWADVVIGTTSSILIEPLLMKKIFIYPRYFHENTMLWDSMNACWTVNNYNELEDALRKIVDKPGYKRYSDRDVNKFITEVVYGGVENRDVLGDYKKFILSLI